MPLSSFRIPRKAPLVAGAGVAALTAAALCYAARWPTSQLFGRTLIAGRDAEEIALTFDDGPNPAVTPQLLEVLARHNVRATFFLIGNYVRQRPALAREIASAGHLVGNHTMSHPALALRPASFIRRELTACTHAIEDAIGAPVHFFRPPFGSRRPAVLQIAAELNLIPVQWNVTAQDWKPIGADAILDNLLAGIRRNQRLGRGSNLLLHDGGQAGLGQPRLDSVEATRRLLEDPPTPCTRFVTVDRWS